jgi:hypothetical protein
MMGIDELWDGPLGGTRSWYERTSPEIRQVLDELADKMVERETAPNWAAVRRYMEERFPGQVPTAKSTIAENVRRLVKARQ